MAFARGRAALPKLFCLDLSFEAAMDAVAGTIGAVAAVASWGINMPISTILLAEHCK